MEKKADAAPWWPRPTSSRFYAQVYHGPAMPVANELLVLWQAAHPEQIAQFYQAQELADLLAEFSDPDRPQLIERARRRMFRRAALVGEYAHSGLSEVNQISHTVNCFGEHLFEVCAMFFAANNPLGRDQWTRVSLVRFDAGLPEVRLSIINRWVVPDLLGVRARMPRISDNFGPEYPLAGERAHSVIMRTMAADFRKAWSTGKYIPQGA